MSRQRDRFEPAWVIHRRPYGDNGLIAELFTADSGRVSAVVRGARRKTRGGSAGGLLQPFVPLLVGLGGQGDLKHLRGVEVAGRVEPLSGEHLFSGLYVNELIIRLLPRFDPHPRLFAFYGELLPRLAEGAEEVLRRFELLLLEELGYQPNFGIDSRGETIDRHALYRFESDLGFVAYLPEHPGAAGSGQAGRARNEVPCWPGSIIGQIAGWQDGEDALPGPALRALKQINRAVLTDHLGGRPLRSRELFRAFLRGGDVTPPLGTGAPKAGATETDSEG